MQLNLFDVGRPKEPEQVFHTYDKWECHKAGFYESRPIPRNESQLKAAYLHVLSNVDIFENAIRKVFDNWHCSCEQYLTNQKFNRIAWIGQAAVCIETAVPSQYCNGWRLLTEEQQIVADKVALEHLNKWLQSNGRTPVTMKKAKGH